MKLEAQTIDAPPASGKARFLFLALLAAVFLSGCATGVKDTSRTYTTVVIDAGHGGHDNGATSRWAGREKDHCLDVARRLETKLRSAGFRTVMTRSSDRFIPLDKRARISNSQGNAIFVSIHFNDTPKRSISGSEVYYRSQCSRQIARKILDEIDALPGTSSRGVKTANFRVLKRNQYPAVLVECGFLSNPSEGSRCATGGYRERLADAIATALIEQRHGKIAPPTGSAHVARN
jgi:N-acetylmuramoyl-L-alanine amidase